MKVLACAGSGVVYSAPFLHHRVTRPSRCGLYLVLLQPGSLSRCPAAAARHVAWSSSPSPPSGSRLHLCEDISQHHRDSLPKPPEEFPMIPTAIPAGSALSPIAPWAALPTHHRYPPWTAAWVRGLDFVTIFPPQNSHTSQEKAGQMMGIYQFDGLSSWLTFRLRL